MLTKNHPIEIVSVVERLYNSLVQNDLKHITCISPQVISLMLEETKGIPYLYSYETAIFSYEKQKEEIANGCTHLITVGYVPKNTRFWYDMIIGYNNEEIMDYNIEERAKINEGYELFKLKDAEVTFEEFETLLFFLKKVTKERKTNDIQ